MPENKDENLDRIARLKTKLFSKKYQTEIEYRDSFSKIPSKKVRQSWDELTKSDKKKIDIKRIKKE